MRFCVRRRVWPAHAQLMPRHSKGDVMCRHFTAGAVDCRHMTSPLRRDAHAEMKKLTGGSIPAPFHFLISKNLSWTGVHFPGVWSIRSELVGGLLRCGAIIEKFWSREAPMWHHLRRTRGEFTALVQQMSRMLQLLWSRVEFGAIFSGGLLLVTIWSALKLRSFTAKSSFATLPWFFARSMSESSTRQDCLRT
jgi:hypothetical protein